MVKKEYPGIEGSEMVSNSWHRLLVRDNAAQTQFAGTEFPDVTEDDVGRPCYRTDIAGILPDRGTWFIFCGFDAEEQPIWWDIFGSLTSENISMEAGSDFPSSVENVDDALRFVANKSFENAIVFPPELTTYTSDGITTQYKLPRVVTNKNTLHVYLSGVLQEPETYSISSDAQYLILNEAPPFGESILISETSSILEYDIMPFVKDFTGDGSNKIFDCSPADLVNEKTIQINIDGKILQFSEYTVTGSMVELNTAPVSGAKIQIQTIYKGQLIAPSAGTVSTESILDNSIIQAKLVDNIITQAKLADNSVSDSKIIPGSVITNKLADGSVTNEKISNEAVDLSKLNQVIIDKLLGSENVTTNNLASKSVSRSKLADDVLIPASTGNQGLVTLATKEEILNGTGGNKVVTAETLYQILTELKLMGG